MSFFRKVELLPADPILSLPLLFQAETNPKKVNLGVGTYRDAEGKSLVLTCVRAAEQQIIAQPLSKDYLPIEGGKEFLQACMELVFGKDLTIAERSFGFQAVGGTSALRVGAEFLKQGITPKVYVSDPSWPNHRLVFQRTGFEVEEYPYYDFARNTIDFEAFCQKLKTIPEASTVLLQACCHNPTGIDPTREQWKQLSTLMKERKLIPFFDLAYQGFGDGLDDDAWAIRHFASEGHEMLVAVSFSKNLGLYGERVGYGCVIAGDPEAAKRVGSHIRQIIRASYSNPGLHGGRLVTTILTSEKLRNEWLLELADMRTRIHEMRRALHSRLLVQGVKKDFDFLSKQKGMFSFIGLSPEQVEQMRSQYGIYVLKNSRINVAGLTAPNLDYVCEAIAKVSGS